MNTNYTLSPEGRAGEGLHHTLSPKGRVGEGLHHTLSPKGRAGEGLFSLSPEGRAGEGFLVILGAGESGTGAAILAKEKGFEVFVSDMGEIKPPYRALLDQHGIAWEDGGHTFDKLKDADEIIKSPGIPNDAPIIRQIQNYHSSLSPEGRVGEGFEGFQGVPVISEIEFAARYTDAKMICITGSNGKTTTTSLIYDILRRAGLNVGLAGNIGASLALQVAHEHHDYYVIELSSFQLDNMYDFRANVAILLNITPDHLDRYNFEFQNYVNAKFRITQNQTKDDAFIYWSEDPVIDREIRKMSLGATLYPFGKSGNAAYIRGNDLVVEAGEPLVMPYQELSLQGKHNQLNSMAASIAAQVLHIKNDVIRESLKQFAGVEHRLQYVATVKGVRWINDSKATNVNSCWYALESMTTPTVLILGGKDKGNDYSEIDDLVREKCHTLIFMGLHNEKLHEHFDKFAKSSLSLDERAGEGFKSSLSLDERAGEGFKSSLSLDERAGEEISSLPCGEGRGEVTIIDTNNLHDAIQAAYHAAHEGDTVLLSPCCASFDLFKSYEDRGNQFMSAVRKL